MILLGVFLDGVVNSANHISWQWMGVKDVDSCISVDNRWVRYTHLLMEYRH